MANLGTSYREILDAQFDIAKINIELEINLSAHTALCDLGFFKTDDDANLGLEDIKWNHLCNINNAHGYLEYLMQR